MCAYVHASMFGRACALTSVTDKVIPLFNFLLLISNFLLLRMRICSCECTSACPKSPVTNAFYSEHITGTNQSFSCRIIGHCGTYFTVQHVTHINDLTATVTLVTMSRHDRSKSNYAKCFRSFHFSQTSKSI